MEKTIVSESSFQSSRRLFLTSSAAGLLASTQASVTQEASAAAGFRQGKAQVKVISSANGRPSRYAINELVHISQEEARRICLKIGLDWDTG